MSDKVFIAGATGTNGRALVWELQTRQVPVRALIRSSVTAVPDFGPGVEIIKGDLADRDSLGRTLDGIARAYIVTAIHQDAVAWFDNFYAAAKAADVRHVVKFSGLGSGGDSPSEVMRQHGASDAMLIESGLSYTILRPNSFHQNMLAQAPAIAKEGRFTLPIGGAAQSTIDVRDIAEISANILTEDSHFGQVYDLTGPEALTFHDVARILSEVRGEPVVYQPITAEEAETAYRQAGLPAWNAHALAEIQDLFATGAYKTVLPDAERLLGRNLRTFREFAADHAEVWRGDGDRLATSNSRRKD